MRNHIQTRTLKRTVDECRADSGPIGDVRQRLSGRRSLLRFNSLNQRLAIFLLLPVAVLLLLMGLWGFVYARNFLVTQWGEATTLKLQRAAHHVDMRLRSPKEILNLFHQTARLPHAMHIQGLLLKQLAEIDGVVGVNLRWESLSDGAQGAKRSDTDFPMRPFHGGAIVTLTPPRYNPDVQNETVTLISELNDVRGQIVGKLEVMLSFDLLIDAVAATGWWQKHETFLVDENGRIISSNMPQNRSLIAEEQGPMGPSLKYTLQSMPFGTVIGEGVPPRYVIGFYHLKEAPWSLVILAPGKEILAPIIRFRFYYWIFAIAFTVVVLVLIRLVTGRTVAAIKDVSQAARNVSAGNYDVALPVKTADEVGELRRSFNSMVNQLEERTRLKASLDLAREVQQNLLPDAATRFEGLDIAGKSIYCDETGGDYYDFYQYPQKGRHCVGVAVGDVADHGVASALFMATARALIRSRLRETGELPQVVGDINRLLCDDTARSGNFMTLFITEIDMDEGSLRWVRAGHEPALLYDTATDTFTELGGEGIALGVDDQRRFQGYRYDTWSPGKILLIGTDGIWEAENAFGERFGKDRFKAIVRRNSHLPSARITNAVTDELNLFRQGIPSADDVTLVVAKAAAP